MFPFSRSQRRAPEKETNQAVRFLQVLPRQAVSRTRPTLEPLEDRCLLIGNLHLTSAFLVDGNDQAITAPVTGEMVSLKMSVGMIYVGPYCFLKSSVRRDLMWNCRPPPHAIE